MNLLSRYVVLELTKVFLVTVCSMTMLMLLVGVVQEAVQQNLTPLTIGQLIPFLIPKALFFAIPATALFAVCNVFARMASANEVLAVKSAGQPPMVFVWPAIVLAFVLSLVTVILNDIAVSWGRQGVYRVILNSVEKTIYAMLNADQKFSNGKLAFSVQHIDGRDLFGLVVERFPEPSKPGFRITAQQARLTSDPDTNKLVIWIKDGTFQFGEHATAVIDEDQLEIDLSEATRKARGDDVSPSTIALRQIPREAQVSRRTLEAKRRDLALAAAFQVLGGNLVGLTDPTWSPQLNALRDYELRRHRLSAEPWRRWANGFSCLGFVMIGAPLALRMSKSDFWVVFFVCFFPILIAYYPLLMFGISQTKTGQLPPVCVWTGNAVLMAVGGALLRRLNRS